MNFDELDTKMRVFETAHDHCVLPGIYMVARLDGRSFTRLTKDALDFDKPFDVIFRDHMVNTTKHLMNVGFDVVYGYTESDEISLLFKRDIDAFNRKTRKYNSVLAGEASAFFTMAIRKHCDFDELPAVFDCRICELPTNELVIDYFRWRAEDAHRNALSGHCYWALRAKGESASSASKKLLGMNTSQKNDFLFKIAGINFNNTPAWQRRGVGLYWNEFEKEGFNPVTSEKVFTTRREIKVWHDLPTGPDYSTFINWCLDDD